MVSVGEMSHKVRAELQHSEEDSEKRKREVKVAREERILQHILVRLPLTSEPAGRRMCVRVRASSVVRPAWCRATDSPSSPAGGTEGILPRNSMAQSPKEFPL